MTLKTKEDVEKYIRENEMDVQSARSNMIAMSIAFSAYANSRKFNGVGFSPMFCYMAKDDFFSQLTPIKGLEGVSKRVGELVMKDIDSINKISKEHVKIEEEIDEIWASINLKESDKELIKEFKKMLIAVEKWWFYATYGEDKGMYLGELAINKFMQTRNIDSLKAREIVNTLAHPNEKSIFTQERIDFLETALDLLERNVKKKEIINDKKFDKNYLSYFSKYFFNKTDFNDRRIITKELFAEEICKEIKNKTKQQVKAELDKIILDNDKLMRDKHQLDEKINLSGDEKKYISAVGEMITLLDYRKRDMMKHFYYIFSILHEFAKRFNVKYGDLSYLTISELVDFTDGKIKIESLDLDKRRKKTIIIFQENSSETFIHGDDAERISGLAMHKGNEIKGNVASKNKDNIVRGIARIIKNPAKENFNSGEILVTSMTRIEYVPLMKKAQAIVTDEGGIACHAAIVSRELGVPCIIGTKVATREIKTGDEIEMDMKTGKVKIIK